MQLRLLQLGHNTVYESRFLTLLQCLRGSSDSERLSR
jgi:hypothetical protein